MSHPATTTPAADTISGETDGAGGKTRRDGIDAVGWSAVRAELDRYGCAVTGPLLTPREAAEIAALYPDDARFRSTVKMSRHRSAP